MTRSDATLVASDGSHRAMKLLNHVVDQNEYTHMAVALVRGARDHLHEACRRFENGDASELHEDLYLPLFDALSLCTEAVRFRHWKPKLVKKAHATLAALFILMERELLPAAIDGMTNRDRETSYRVDAGQEGGGRHA